MKKIILLSFMLVWHNLCAAPTKSAPPAHGKATSAAQKNTKKTAPAVKAEKPKPAIKKNLPPKTDKAKTAEKKAVKPGKGKTADTRKAKQTPATAKTEKGKTGSPKTVAKPDKTKDGAQKITAKTQSPKTGKKTALVKADKQSLPVAKASEAKKHLAQQHKGGGKPAKKAAAHAPSLFANTAAGGTDKTRSAVLNQGKKLIGTPYLWGGTTPKGFDCSGLVHYLYEKQGITVPRNSREQFARLPETRNPQPGDLVFFRRNGTINHVGLYLGGNKMLHSPQTGAKVRIEDIDRPKWKRRYAGARRALKHEKTMIVGRAPQKKIVGQKVAKIVKKGAVEQRLAKRTQKEKKTLSNKGKVLTAR